MVKKPTHFTLNKKELNRRKKDTNLATNPKEKPVKNNQNHQSVEKGLFAWIT